MIRLFPFMIAVESPLPMLRTYDGPQEVIAVAQDPVPELPARAPAIVVTPHVDPKSATHRARTPRPGLFIAGGALLYAVSTTLRFVQYVEFGDHVCHDTAQCTDCVNVPLAIVVGLSTPLVVDPASVALVAIGADRLGQRDAERMASGRQRPRGQLGYLGGGGTLAGIGLLGGAATFVLWLTSSSPSDAENIAREGGRQVAVALAVVGGGLVAYGSSLSEHRVRRHRRAAARLGPQVSRRQLGLALTWRY